MDDIKADAINTIGMKNLLFVLLFMGIIACDNRGHDNVQLDNGPALAENVLAKRARGITTIANSGESFAADVDAINPTPQDATQTQKLIKQGNIRFRSKDINADYAAIVDLLPASKAYIEYENQSRDNRQVNYTMTIRVEANQFDQLYQSIVGISKDVLDKSINVQDVTERFYDLETRIKNKKSLELRYLALLEKATKMSDILQVERNLNQVRTDIERMQGQFNYLNKQIGYSTISLSFFEVLPYTSPTTERATFGSRLLASLNNGWEGILSFIVSLVSLWPILLLSPIGIYLFIRIRSKRKNDFD